LRRKAMSPHQNGLDRRPGSVPDIRTDVRGLTFVMRPSGKISGELLIIRCDDSGEVWISIQPDIVMTD
jgi:hypothetical protein